MYIVWPHENAHEAIHSHVIYMQHDYDNNINKEGYRAMILDWQMFNII